MPIIKSAKKRVRVARKATARNVRTKRSVRASWKAFSAKPSAAAVSEVQKALDSAVKKGVIHKNKAARQKSRLSAQAKAAGVKLAKKTTAKASPSVKKVPVKKTSTKKAPTSTKTSSKK